MRIDEYEIETLIIQNRKTYEESIPFYNLPQAALDIKAYVEKQAPKLEDLLATYLGELMHQADSEHDWIMKDKIINRINAVHLLLGIPGTVKTWYQKFKKVSA